MPNHFSVTADAASTKGFPHTPILQFARVGRAHSFAFLLVFAFIAAPKCAAKLLLFHFTQRLAVWRRGGRVRAHNHPLPAKTVHCGCCWHDARRIGALQLCTPTLAPAAVLFQLLLFHLTQRLAVWRGGHECARTSAPPCQLAAPGLPSS